MTTAEKLVYLVEEYGTLKHPEALKELSAMMAKNERVLEEIATIMLENEGFNKDGVPLAEANSKEYDEQQESEDNVVLYGLTKPKNFWIFRPPVSLTLEEKMEIIKK